MKASLTSFLFPILLLGFALTTTNCKKDDPPARDAFLGVYAVTETCTFGNDTYDMTIATSTVASNAVNIVNLYDSGLSLAGTINGNTLTIPNQTIGGVAWSGNGNLNNRQLTLTFSANNSSGQDNCTAICQQK